MDKMENIKPKIIKSANNMYFDISSLFVPNPHSYTMFVTRLSIEQHVDAVLKTIIDKMKNEERT